MALYEGLKSSRGGEAPPPPRRPQEALAPRAPRQAPSPVRPEFTTLRANLRDESRHTPLMDRFLGAGSGRALAQAGGALFGSGRPAERPAPAAPTPPRAAPKRGLTTARMQVVGAGQEEVLPQGRRGLGRAFLVAVALAGSMAVLRPWQRLGMLRSDWSALFKLPAGLEGSSNDGDAAAQQQALVAQKREAAEDTAKLAALPFQAGTGRALGLWQDSSGRWWRVDGEGALAPCSDPASADNLGLPELRGVAAHPEAYHGGRRLLLDLPPGRLGELLPLEGAVASEVRSLELGDPASPVLLTLDGTRCLMGDADWSAHQRRLALVLADLAARRRRASQIDLRFEGTAVVRPLGR